MSNVLIIKHGSLGDIAQASGVIQDIFEHHKQDKIYALPKMGWTDSISDDKLNIDISLGGVQDHSLTRETKQELAFFWEEEI